MTGMAVPALVARAHNLLVYRRIWRGSVFGTFLSPVLFLTAMGMGLGSFVPPTTTALRRRALHRFLAPGCWPRRRCRPARRAVVAAHGQSAGSKNFEAMIATPQRSRDIVLGHIGWLASAWASSPASS